MASLTANVAIRSWEKKKPMPMRCVGADVFFRGALVFFASGQIDPLVAATGTEFAGIVAEATTTTAANDPVLVYPASNGGTFLLANTAFTIANQGLLFHQTIAGEDDPSTLTTTATANSGAVGRLVQVKTTAVDGWLDIGDRFAPVQA